MTRQQFHTKLLKLLQQAHKRGFCAGCVVAELIAAAEAISILAELSNKDLMEHGIPALQPLEEVQREHLH